MRIAILGYGRQGKSAFEYWKNGNEITICDFNKDLDLPKGVTSQLGEHYLDNLEDFKLIVRSPLIHPREIVKANGEHVLSKVTTVTEEFFRNCQAPIIGVTGTKGKGTTSIIISKLLEGAGKRVHLGGNIGIPPLDMLAWGIKPEDWVVLELANFQLIDLGVSPKIGVCTMVIPEHLDWHTDLAEYVHSKQNLFRYQNDKDIAIFNRLSDLSGEVAEVSPALKTSYEVPPEGQSPSERNGCYVDGDKICLDDEIICSVNDVKLLGRHNLENVCAAITATWDIIGNDSSLVKKVLNEITGLPNRLELVRELNGVKYYNDSFASAAGATIAAIEAVKANKVLIIGGYDRHLDITNLANEIKLKENDFRRVLLIGATADFIASQLDKVGYSNYEIAHADTMAEIVAIARDLAQSGDVVLLSPGFASFDMFKDFEDRGNQFRDEVNKL